MLQQVGMVKTQTGPDQECRNNFRNEAYRPAVDLGLLVGGVRVRCRGASVSVCFFSKAVQQFRRLGPVRSVFPRALNKQLHVFDNAFDVTL